MSGRAPRGILSRRDLVVLGVRAVAGGVALCVLGCDEPRSSRAADEPTEWMLPASFSDLPSMRLVGKKYLELHPEETLPKLLSELGPSRGFAALDTEIRRQYASGEVVRLAGWLIALTEARIYAVVALRP